MHIRVPVLTKRGNVFAVFGDERVQLMLLKYFSDVFKPFFYLLKRFTAEIIGNVVLKQQGDASADIKHMDNTIVVGRFG